MATPAKFITKNVYGNELIYPDNVIAKLLIDLTGKKTAGAADLRIIKRLGYAVVVDARDYFTGKEYKRVI